MVRVRPTMSLDGIERASFRVLHRVSREMMLDIIAERFTPVRIPGPDWSANRVRREVHNYLQDNGAALSSQGHYSELDEESAAWVRRMVAKVWPEEDVE